LCVRLLYLSAEWSVLHTLPDNYDLVSIHGKGNVVFAIGTLSAAIQYFAYSTDFGVTWKEDREIFALPLQSYTDVFVLDENNIYVAGGAAYKIYTKYNDEWVELPIDDIYPSKLWAANNSKLWISDAGGKEKGGGYWDGITYTNTPPVFPYDEGYDNAKIFGFSDTSIFAVSTNGKLAEYAGSDWNTIDDQIGSSLATLKWYGLWGIDADNIWCVGEDSSDNSAVIGFWNGSTMVKATIPSGLDSPLRAIYGVASDNIIAVGDDGTILKFNGTSWSTLEAGSYGNIRGVWMTYVRSAGEYLKEWYDHDDIDSAVVIPEKKQVIFFASGDLNIAPVYNYQFNNWSTFTNHKAYHAIERKGLYYFIDRDNAQVRVENRGFYDDAGAAITFRLDTGWLSLAGLAGYKRTRKVLIIGQNLEPHTITIAAQFDFDPTWYTAQTFSTSDIGLYFDAQDYYWDFTDDNYLNSAMLLEAAFNKQKCSAIRLKITHTTSNKASSITGLVLVAAMKQGSARRGSAKKFS